MPMLFLTALSAAIMIALVICGIFGEQIVNIGEKIYKVFTKKDETKEENK